MQVKKLFNFIMKFGNAKMLRYIVKIYNINLNEELENIYQFFLYLVRFFFNFYKLDCIDYLLNESNLCFSFSIPKPILENSNTISFGLSEDGNSNKNNHFIVINEKNISVDKKPFHLNDLRSINGDEIIVELIFIRYKKLFYVYKYSTKPVKIDLSVLLTY